MTSEIGNLLTLLEEVNSRAAENSDPSLNTAVDVVAVLELIKERGRLIEQLQPLLALHAPVSYVEWNRLVVIHHQGALISENLGRVRNQVALELGTSYGGRLFLERMTGMLGHPQNQS